MPAERAYVLNMAATLMTAEELLHTHIPNKRVELVRGVLVVHEPPGYEHGRITAELGFFLTKHIKETGIGQLVIRQGRRLARRRCSARLGNRSRATSGPRLSARWKRNEHQ
jgi:Uma2 family endonuclease